MHATRIWFWMASLAFCLLTSSAVIALDDAPTKTAKGPLNALDRVNAFLSLLDETQKAKTVLPFDSEKRVEWHFIPMNSRKGLPLMEMNAQQRKTAMQLLRACLSPEGFQKSQDIMNLERLLKQIEGNKGTNERNPDKYYVTVFGSPDAGQRWGLSFEGHHLSLNFVFQGSRIVDSTPQFMAANPARIATDYEGFPQGTQVLEPEQQLAFQLLGSLNEAQRGTALLPDAPPAELVNAATPQPLRLSAPGLHAGDMNEQQQDLLKQLLMAYTSKMKKRISGQRWQLIEEAGWDKISFAWQGGLKAGEKHYYAIQGPTFMVEYINVQPDAAGNPANHIHCVWRDLTGDFDLPID
jgi:hypothetical protein